MVHDCTLDDIAAALAYLDCTDTDVWLRAGMAIKSEFGEGGFDAWDDWSRGDDRYKAKEARARWKSFKGGSARGKVSIGTILHWAFERGFKIERPKLTAEQKETFAVEQAKRRAQLAELAVKEEADIQHWYDVVADAAKRMEPLLKRVGNSPYLGIKKISSCGCLFPTEPFLLDFKPDFTIDIVTDRDAINTVFARVKVNKAEGNDDDAIVYVKRGSILIPLYDATGVIKNYQIIYNDGKSKRFLTNGQKSGLYYVIGSLDDPDKPILFCEGFATGASLHMATGWPVVVCFDAGNLPVVAGLDSWLQLPRIKLIAGDNDWETALDPKKRNTGVIKAKAAAAILGCAWCVAQFAGDATGLSDFNDVHATAGLPEVKRQIEAALSAPPPPDSSPDSPPDYGEIPLDYDLSHDLNEREQYLGDESSQDGFTIDILLSRFRFVAEDGSAFDTKIKSQIKKTAFNDLVGKTLADEWRSSDKKLVIAQGAVDDIVRAVLREKRRAAVTNEWERKFLRNDNGEIKGDIFNTRLVLQNDTRWRGVIGYCDFSYRVMKLKAPPFQQGRDGEWSDADTDRLRIWLSEKYRFTPKTADALGAVVVVAEANRFHPVRDYGNALVWDGTNRLDFWLSAYLGAQQTVYSALVGRMFLLGAVARVMQPPVKMDTVLIFEGLQGMGKSTALKILGGDWFTDTPLVLGDKDGFQQMQGVWIIELAELDSFNKAEHTRAKQFFGSQTDRYRPSYGRLTQTFARQCVFAGTTNQGEYLRDATGNRRYWPVKCTQILAEELQRDRDQIWAEAWHRYNSGEKWWPDENHKQLFESEQESRFEADVWEEMIEGWLRSITKDRVLMSEIMQDALSLEPSQMKPPEQKRVGSIMSHLGWTKCRPRVAGGRETGYERPESFKFAV